MGLKVYDSKKVAFMINGTEFGDELEGVIEIDNKESIKTRVGTTGKPLLSRNPEAEHASIKFTVVKNSHLNALLNGFEKSNGTFPIAIVDMNSKDSNTSGEAIVTQKPKPKYGDDSGLEWTVYATYLDSNILGGA